MNQALVALTEEVRLFYQSLVQLGDEIHSTSAATAPISMGMRAVLEFLEREGDCTVPDMARARRVTRQRIQTLVNNLAALSLVHSRDNPATRRSPLIALTREGARTIADMRKREGRYLKLDMDARRLLAAAQTLRSVRTALEAQRGGA